MLKSLILLVAAVEVHEVAEDEFARVSGHNSAQLTYCNQSPSEQVCLIGLDTHELSDG